jgi:hypothetical protein
MSIRHTLTLTVILTLTLLISVATNANANANETREFLGAIGKFQNGNTAVGPIWGVAGLAIDLETGNIYVTDNYTKTVQILGPNGGPPDGGVPAEITGVGLETAEGESSIAVDNSCFEHQPRLTGKACEEYDPSYGDVFVTDEDSHGGEVKLGVQKFALTSGGSYELIGAIDYPENSVSGVTVDSRGNVYLAPDAYHGEYFVPAPVVEYKKIVEKIEIGGKEEFEEKLEEIDLPQNTAATAGYVAVDDKHELVYVASSREYGKESEGDRGVAKLTLDPAGSEISAGILTGSNGRNTYRPVAVDPVTGAVFVGNAYEIAEYNAAGELQNVFGSTEPAGGSLGKKVAGTLAIAVNGETERIYVANQEDGDIDVFGGLVGPPVIEDSQPPASAIAGTSARVVGEANPDSGQGASCYFEYVDAEEYAPGSPEPYAAGGRTAILQLPGGHTAESTPAVELAGLRAGVTYDYRLVAQNASATVYGPDEKFTTLASTPPAVGTGAAVEVGFTSATLTGSVDPQGLPTSYVFEIGTNTGYSGARLFGNAGAGTATVAVSATLQYLVPGTTYHYRLSATSFDGTSYGQDGSFTTGSVPPPFGAPASTALLSVPIGRFPTVTGAIVVAKGKSKGHPKSTSGARSVKLARALRLCREQKRGRAQAACERAARKGHRASR